MARWPGTYRSIVRWSKRDVDDLRSTARSRRRGRRPVTLYTYDLDCGHSVSMKRWVLERVRCPVCTGDPMLAVVEKAIDAALGELVRQTGALDPQLLKEARGAGVAEGRFQLTHVRSR